MSLCGCHHIDDNRVPSMPVNITFATAAEWDIYGVSGAMTWHRFIRQDRVPANYPYTAMTYTGYGGVLLVGDMLGEPKAFDLCCPVELKQDVRVAVDPDNEFLAVCPRCGSRYDVFSLLGYPVGGPAAEKGYGLRQYRVEPGRGGEPYVIHN